MEFRRVLFRSEKERSGTAVDLDAAQRDAGNFRAQPEPADQRARDTAAAAQRLCERRRLAATVAGQLHVVSEQRLEPSEIAVLGGLKEPLRQLVALLARGSEARPALLHMAPSAAGELADAVLA